MKPDLKTIEMLLESQNSRGRWSNSYHDDIQTTIELLDAYEKLKKEEIAVKIFSAAQLFMRRTRLNKLPFTAFGMVKNARPKGYLLTDFKPGVETTLLHAQMCFKMFMISYNIDDYLEGAVSLITVQKNYKTFPATELNEARKLHDTCVPEVLKRWV